MKDWSKIGSLNADPFPQGILQVEDVTIDTYALGKEELSADYSSAGLMDATLSATFLNQAGSKTFFLV